jgi:hypothetical protein
MSWILSFVLSLLLGTCIFFITHRKDKILVKPTLALLFGVLRGLVAAIITLLICNPIWISKSTIEEKPNVVLMLDNSTSMLHHFNNDTQALRSTWQRIFDELSEKYDVDVLDLKANNINLNGKFDWANETNLSVAIDLLAKKNKVRKIDEAILVSDGISNLGVDATSYLDYLNFPLNTLVIGDTTTPLDIAVNNILFNKSVSLGADFEVIVDIGAYKSSGENVEVQILHQDKIITKSNRKINSSSEVVTLPFILNANNKGFQHYQVKVLPLEGERNIANNSQEFILEVIDESIKVSIISSRTHPDVGAIQNLLSHNSRFEVRVVKGINDAKLLDADVIIAHQPNVEHVRQLRHLDKPIWFIIGVHSQANIYGQIGLKQNGNINGHVDILNSLNSNFSSFQIDDKAPDVLSQLPPMQGLFVDISNGSEILLYQKIGSVTTQKPLWFFEKQQKYTDAFLVGEGLWRWKLYEYKINKNNDVLNSLITQTILHIKSANLNKKFKINIDKNNYNDFEYVNVYATYRDKQGELSNLPEVKISLLKNDTMQSSDAMDRIANSYKKAMGLLDEGIYTIKAELRDKNEVYKDAITFNVKAMDLESYRTHADYFLMSQLANLTGGRVGVVKDIDNWLNSCLVSENLKVKLKEQIKEKTLIDSKIIFFIILLLMSIDWVLRKYNNM